MKVCSGIGKGGAKFSSSPSSSHDAPRCQDIVIYSKIKFVTLTLIRSCSILLTSKPLDQCCGSKSIKFESGSRILASFLSVGSLIGEFFVFNLTPFAYYLSYFHRCGSGSGSVFEIRIRIHNAALAALSYFRAWLVVVEQQVLRFQVSEKLQCF